MTGLELTLFGVGWQGAVLLRAFLLASWYEGHSSATTTPMMMTGYPLISPSLISLFTGGVGAEEVEVTRVVVTSMKLTPPEGGKRKRMDFLARSKYPNLGARRVILMKWPMPLGSGPAVSLTIVITMRIPTSCPWWCLPWWVTPRMCSIGHGASLPEAFGSIHAPTDALGAHPGL